MKKRMFHEDSDGFCGNFKQIPDDRQAVVIITEDEYPDSLLVKKGLAWLNRMSVSAMGIGPEKSWKGMHSWPLENIENAVRFLQSEGYRKIGICGLSAGSNMALSAAARIPDITLTIALTPMDWVYWGTWKDGLDGAPERPADGESAYTWRGTPLSYMPSPWRHPDYWEKIKQESRRRGDRIAGLDFHDLAEEMHPLTDAERIPVEQINGYLLLAGARDDVLWNTCKAIDRMRERLENADCHCKYEALIYEHCSHFIFPESMMGLFLPKGAVDLLLPRIFSETKGYVKECRSSRVDLDIHIRTLINHWIGG